MRNELRKARHLIRLLAILVLGVVLAACGGEDADDEPTATSAPSDAQPTVVVDDEETDESTPDAATGTDVPENIDMSAVSPEATPGDDATPIATAIDQNQALGEAASDATPGIDDATPAVTGPDDGIATPDAEVTGEVAPIPAAPDVGDGTTGAFVFATPEKAESATPAAQEDQAVATPVASPASPAASPVALLSVTSCDVPDVPEFTGEQTSYRATTDLNFRIGPGADCELALDEPLGEAQVVEVIGGPVTREDDGSEWAQVRVLDTEGWVSFEFIEPVED